MKNQSNICVAEVKSAYGIKGWVWLYSYTDPIEAVFDYSPLYFQTKTKLEKPVEISQWRRQGKGIVAKFQGVDTRNDAEAIQTQKIYIHQHSLPKLDSNNFYWTELTGMMVVSNKGNTFGKVKQLFETAAHPILEVVPTSDSLDDETRLIPWHESTVTDVDRTQDIILVDWEADF